MDKLSKCENVAELLALYHYGELTGAKAKLVESHLAGCEGCRDELAGIRRTLGLITPELPAQAEAARARARVMDRLGKARRGPLRWLTPALAAVALVVVMALVFNDSGPFTPQGESPAVQVRTAGVDVEILEDYELVSNLDMLEDMDTLEHMEEL